MTPLSSIARSFPGFLQFMLSRMLPNRPDGGGTVSLFARIEGCGKNIRVSEGATLQSHAWLACGASPCHIDIARGTVVNSYAKLRTQGGFISIGSNCSIHSYCVLYGAGGITIGDHVRIAVHSSIIAGNHGFMDAAKPLYEQAPSARGIVIEDDVWIGAGAIILDGVRVGSHSVIGAGAVVTKNVPPYSVALGVPARSRKRAY